MVRHCLEIRNVEQAPGPCSSECCSAGLGSSEEKREQEMLPGGGHIAPGVLQVERGTGKASQLKEHHRQRHGGRKVQSIVIRNN